MPTSVLTLECPNQSPNANLPTGILSWSYKNWLREKVSLAAVLTVLSTLPGLSRGQSTVFSVPTLSLLFVLNKLTPFCNTLRLGIFSQLVFRLPWQELFIFLFLKKKSRKVILISDHLVRSHVNSDYETTPHFLYILPTATWMTDRSMHAGRPFSHVRLFAVTVAHQAPLLMGILQARILEWAAMPSSRGSLWPQD